jgi:hypothetical protein
MKARAALLALALAAAPLGWASAADPPARILRLGLVEGGVAYRPAAVGNVTTPGPRGELPTAPLMPGDALSTRADGRAELSLGTATIRIANDTDLTVDRLDESAVRLVLERGTASVVVRDLLEDETLEIATPETTVALTTPGDYRIDVTADGGTDISVRRGVATAESAGGAVRIAEGQRALLAGTDAYASLIAPLAPDAFDNWVLDREVQLAEAAPPDDDGEYRALDDYGDWVDDPHYGRVWTPSYAYGGYDPYAYGSWTQYSYSGYSWNNPMPWGYYTGFGYGHWAYLHDRNRWCWVPPRRDHHRPPRNLPPSTAPLGHPRHHRPYHTDREPEPVVTTRNIPRNYEGWGVPSQRGNDTPQTPTRVVLSKPASPVGKPAPKPAAQPATPPARPAPTSSGSKPSTTMKPAPVKTETRSSSPTVTSSASKGTVTPREP